MGKNGHIAVIWCFTPIKDGFFRNLIQFETKHWRAYLFLYSAFKRICDFSWFPLRSKAEDLLSNNLLVMVFYSSVCEGGEMEYMEWGEEKMKIGDGGRNEGAVWATEGLIHLSYLIVWT